MGVTVYECHVLYYQLIVEHNPVMLQLAAYSLRDVLLSIVHSILMLQIYCVFACIYNKDMMVVHESDRYDCSLSIRYERI